jgi:2-keto-3-deoxy-L-fuconate dehydrogenase
MMCAQYRALRHGTGYSGESFAAMQYGKETEMSPSAASSSPFRLEGRHALVTGGASGIGEATVKELVRAGAFVWVADINLAAAEALAGSIGSAHALSLDVTSLESIAGAVAQVKRLDILVNNAGIGHVGSIEATEPEDFDRLLNVNVRAVYLVTRAFIPLLLAAQDDAHTGSIVNIASVAGQVGIKQRFAYCTTKGAVIAMTRQLAVEYPKSLRVNAVCPGTVETPFVEAYLEKFHKHNKEEVRAELRARQPVGRLGRPDEVASMVRYLASDEAAFINGAAMAIDGGWTAA